MLNFQGNLTPFSSLTILATLDPNQVTHTRISRHGDLNGPTI